MLLPIHRVYPWLLQNLIWIPTRLLFKFFLRLKIEGTEHLAPLSPGLIFALNHTSELDPVILPASLPFLSRFGPMFYTSRERAFYKTSGWRQLFYGGLFFKIWGAYPVIPSLKDRDTSLNNHIEIIERGGSVCIFPEGGKSKDGNLRPPRSGVAYLSWKTGAPVVPVSIKGLYRLSPRDFIGRRRNVVLRFGRPLFPRDIFDSKAESDGDADIYKFFRPAAELIMKRIAEGLR